jgi:hypothetical protein
MTDWIARARHWVAHKLGQNGGQVECWWQDGKLLVGFRCDGCGKMDPSSIFESIGHRWNRDGHDRS